METLEPILEKHPFLKGLQPHHLKILVGCASNVRFEAGSFIFREGEEAERFYLIREGRVALQLSSDRRGPLNILTLREGDILGWSWLFPPIDGSSLQKASSLRALVPSMLNAFVPRLNRTPALVANF